MRWALIYRKILRPYAANPRIIAKAIYVIFGNDSLMIIAIIKEPVPQHNPLMVTI